MNTTQLEYFIELAYTLSYTKASLILDIAQPTLSKAIDHLEEELGFELFYKKGRQIFLSEQGQKFLPYAEKSLNILSEGIIKADFKGQQINIGSIIPMEFEVVPFIISEYRKLYPDSLFSLYTSVTRKLLNMLIKEEIDLAFCSKISDHEELVFLPLCEQKLYVALYKGHPLENKQQLEFSDLAAFEMVVHTENAAMRKIIDNIMKLNGFKPKISSEADEDIGLLGMVKRKMGFAIIGDAPDIYLADIIYKPLIFNGPKRFVYLVYRKKDEGRYKEFIQIAENYKKKSSNL